MQSTPYAVSGGAWHAMDMPYSVSSGAWHQIDNGWSVSGGVWHPMWDKLVLPQLYQNSTSYAGRYGAVGGTIWGNTRAYTYWDLPTASTVVGVTIQINVTKPQGGYHGTDGLFAASDVATQPASYPWTSPAGTGIQNSPVLPCNIPAGGRIYIHVYGGGSDSGDGKQLYQLYLTGVVYA